MSANEPLDPKQSTVEAGDKKPLSETLLRFLTAGWLVPVVVYAIVQGGLIFLAVVTGILLLGLREFYLLIEEKGARPLWGLGLAAGGALPTVAYLGTEYHATLLMTASLLALMVAQLRKNDITEALASISGTFFGVFYVGWLLSHAVPLRHFYETALSRYDPAEVVAIGLAPGAGIFFFIYALTVVINCDAGAYFAGRAYGRHKLAPQVSPGKTWEGALGGILWGTLAGAICKGLFDFVWPGLSASFEWGAVLVFGVVLSMVGIVGDLVESLLKRDAQLKDTGRLLPGMGGVLDRIDSPLLGIPVMHYMLLGYVYWRLA